MTVASSDVWLTCQERLGRKRTLSVGDSADGFITVMSRKAKRIDRRNSKEGNYDVCISSKKSLPKQFGLAKLLRAENIANIEAIKYKGPYRVIVSFKNKQDAENLKSCQKLVELEYKCISVDEVDLSFGMVKDVDLDLDEAEILKEFSCDCEIVAIKRLKRINDLGEWVYCEKVRLTFKTPTLPPYIFGYGCRFKVEPYAFPVTQCSTCWRFGHFARICPTQRTVCPKCSEKHSNCETTQFKCINCKGSHMALDKSCPLYLKEKEIRVVMSKDNCTYRVALAAVVQKKKNEATFLTEKSMEVCGDETNKNKTFTYRDALVNSLDTVEPVINDLTTSEKESEDEERNDSIKKHKSIIKKNKIKRRIR